MAMQTLEGTNDPARSELILDYWFGEISPSPQYQKEKGRLWFGGEAATDREIRERFAADVEAAAAGKFADWEQNPRAALALVILLDQFPLNIFRNEARSYELCDLALPIALRAIDRGFAKRLHPIEATFLYLPLEHAEDLSLQERSVRLYRELKDSCADTFWKNWLQESYDYAVRHLEVVQRFGRFPHRNEALGRNTTPAEREFLAKGRPF